MNTTEKVMATYGHGTENDFVLVFDPDDKISISPSQVAAICNRATGIGSDGLIRITKQNGRWLMDYRNVIDTRAGLKHLRVPASGDITVNMGQVSSDEDEITVRVQDKVWQGYNIDIGNPHAVVFVNSLDEAGDLKEAPLVTPKDAYPEGVNVEFVEFGQDRELKMRVFERGVGETRSCGTGTCAVALAASISRREKLPARWVIFPPGGRLEVEIDGHSNATLTGPAVLLSEHDITSFLTEASK
jgi:diaminopimelate epimerase